MLQPHTWVEAIDFSYFARHSRHMDCKDCSEGEQNSDFHSNYHYNNCLYNGLDHDLAHGSRPARGNRHSRGKNRDSFLEEEVDVDSYCKKIGYWFANTLKDQQIQKKHMDHKI